MPVRLYCTHGLANSLRCHTNDLFYCTLLPQTPNNLMLTLFLLALPAESRPHINYYTCSNLWAWVAAGILLSATHLPPLSLRRTLGCLSATSSILINFLHRHHWLMLNGLKLEVMHHQHHLISVVPAGILQQRVPARLKREGLCQLVYHWLAFGLPMMQMMGRGKSS